MDTLIKFRDRHDKMEAKWGNLAWRDKYTEAERSSFGETADLAHRGSILSSMRWLGFPYLSISRYPVKL